MDKHADHKGKDVLSTFRQRRSGMFTRKPRHGSSDEQYGNTNYQPKPLDRKMESKQVWVIKGDF